MLNHQGDYIILLKAFLGHDR